jgi:hypothetical protein
MADDKGINLIVKRLQSDDTKEVLFTINQIRNSGDPLIITSLLDLLINNPNKEITKTIIKLLNELKNQASTIEIIKALKNDKYVSLRQEILASCWNSGLDYSNYLAFFVAVFISDEFLIAFEAFTIIENFEKEYDKEIIDPLIQDIKNSINGMDENKRSLSIELVHMLEHKKLSS